MTRWNTIETAPAGVLVETKIDDANGERNVQALKRDGRLWWMPDGSMYVYYTPTHWRPLAGQAKVDHDIAMLRKAHAMELEALRLRGQVRA